MLNICWCAVKMSAQRVWLKRITGLLPLNMLTVVAWMSSIPHWAIMVVHDWEKVLYGYVVLCVQAFCIDQVVNSRRRSVQFFIISQKYEEIGKRINVDADRGVTVVNASGFYSGQDVKMLFVLAKQRQAPAIFRLISEIDPHAFVSQSAVIGVYGEGFDKIKYKSKKEHGV